MRPGDCATLAEGRKLLMNRYRAMDRFAMAHASKAAWNRATLCAAVHQCRVGIPREE
jgi:hypothetical protein